MADFVEKTVNKSALRELTFPIPDVETFDEIVWSVIDENPFGCVGYTTKAGEIIAPVIRNREHYTAKVNFIDDEGKKVGAVSIQSPSIAAYEANAAAIMNNAAIAAAMGGEAIRDFAHETSYCQLKCHDTAGDDYYVTFTNKTVRLSSYQDDAICNTVETWADKITSLE